MITILSHIHLLLSQMPFLCAKKNIKNEDIYSKFLILILREILALHDMI